MEVGGVVQVLCQSFTKCCKQMNEYWAGAVAGQQVHGGWWGGGGAGGACP